MNKLHLAVVQVNEGDDDGWAIAIWSYAFGAWTLIIPPTSFHRCMEVLGGLDFSRIEE